MSHAAQIWGQKQVKTAQCMPSFGIKDLKKRKKSSQEDRKERGEDTGHVINFCYRLIWIAYPLYLI